MNENFKFENSFVKNSANLGMLRKSLESKEIDKDIVSILEKFFSLPITPRESCYGHPEKDSSPYLSYVEDDVKDEQSKKFQRLFRGKVMGLTRTINERIGSEVVNIILERIDHGGGPKDYTVRFEVINKKSFQENGKKVLDIIWSEFSKFIDELK
jgi:hypothetical protein